jgi:hypothetical protein
MNRPMISLALGLLVLCAGSASIAQPDDVIGIYFDPAYTQTEISITDLPAMVTGYLVLKNPTSGYPVNGWECCAEIEGDAIFVSWELEGQALNVLTPPCFTVGIGGEPLPYGDDILLATFEVLVESPTPVIFSLDQTYFASIPDEMAYLSGANGDELFAMYTATGLPQVASINEDTPWPEVFPAALSFGERPIGSTTTRNLTVSNVGGGLLYLDISVPDSVPEFFLPGLSGETYVPGGTSVTVPVEFTPSTVGWFYSVLDLGPEVPEVALQGLGREAIVAWTLEGDLDFPEIAVGSLLSRNLLITNTGEAPFVVSPALDESCAGFQINDIQPFMLDPGDNANVVVRFEPPYAGEFACDLDLGPTLGSVPITGSAHDPVTSYTVTPDSLDFGQVVATTSQAMELTIFNSGETSIALNVTLDDPSGYYHLDLGGGDQDLPPESSHLVRVIFAPMAVGQFDAMVNLGGIVPPVPMTGQGTEANPECLVTPLELAFEPTEVGQTRQRLFFVENLGNVPLVVEPFETSEHFHIIPTPQTIEPGSIRQFVVYFNPQEVGFWECDISLGGPGCPPVQCSGTGLDPDLPPGDNLVGIFFDPDYTEIFGDTYGPGTIQAYLVLKEPSVIAGVKGWECRHEVDGPGTMTGVELMGQALNIGTPPDFVVGLAEPLPPTPDVHLATFTYFVNDLYEEVILTLNPASIPSIPGYMAFLSGDDPDLILPMFPFTGISEVAYINADVLDVARPVEPTVTADGGTVQLEWDLPAGSWQGYHVYRREETGRELKLTDSAGLISGDRVSFSDQPTGFAPGTVLYYSYTLINNGSEGSRSIEARVQLDSVPVLATRLLANVPNPFNPQTTIHFDLARPGAVRLSVFDLSGRLVRTLEESSLPVGSHQRVWQGRDNSGRQAPSGAYYLRLETPDGVDHRKIMLLK